MPIPDETEPRHVEREKLSKQVLFLCTEREHRGWQRVWGANNLSKTIRMLLNAAVAQRAKGAKR